ncbi:hypothetical protein J3R30DRAFT_3739871 [Lentinula aciculospora]|uniref:Uncharacterized protein n=1 Tax=Lentinula aciculospora TaxID=153920 RepID=A0A9W8ZVL9_9AGAR|nr:hypothetical protein J3R30DRAFT_3739871 [Lentinula aciculospora]
MRKDNEGFLGLGTLHEHKRIQLFDGYLAKLPNALPLVRGNEDTAYPGFINWGMSEDWWATGKSVDEVIHDELTNILAPAPDGTFEIKERGFYIHTLRCIFKDFVVLSRARGGTRRISSWLFKAIEAAKGVYEKYGKNVSLDKIDHEIGAK